jgi:hypothetical protein
MALFKKKPKASQPAAPSWSPHVDLPTARPVVFALANAPKSNDAQVRSAIADFVRLSERPSLERALHDPESLHRPWVWLAASMRQAAAADDHHMASAALFWACYWTSGLVPQLDLGAFVELELDPIPEQRKAEIQSLGVASAQQLPNDFVVVGDETGAIYAGSLAATAATQLGL